jgi:hypothetical protein
MSDDRPVLRFRWIWLLWAGVGLLMWWGIIAVVMWAWRTLT